VQVDPITIRKHDVAQEKIKLMSIERGDRVLTPAGDSHFVPMQTKQLCQYVRGIGVIFHEKDLSLFGWHVRTSLPPTEKVIVVGFVQLSIPNIPRRKNESKMPRRSRQGISSPRPHITDIGHNPNILHAGA